MKRLLVVAVSAALSTAILAAEAKKLTLDVTGTFWPGCAGKIAAALDQGGLKAESKLKATKKDPQRVVVEAAEEADLGAAADKVNKAETPHKDQAPPGMSVVLFAKLDKDSAKKAEDAVEKVKGVDKAGTKADAEKGEVTVKLTGSDKVTVNDLVKALDGAGVKASTTKG